MGSCTGMSGPKGRQTGMSSVGNSVRRGGKLNRQRRYRGPRIHSNSSGTRVTISISSNRPLRWPARNWSLGRESTSPRMLPGPVSIPSLKIEWRRMKAQNKTVKKIKFAPCVAPWTRSFCASRRFGSCPEASAADLCRQFNTGTVANTTPPRER